MMWNQFIDDFGLEDLHVPHCLEHCIEVAAEAQNLRQDVV
jgi:hypothetical protein